MPARKPDAYKNLAGTARPCRARRETLNRLEAAPAPPDYLSPSAAEEWQRIAPVAADVGMTLADVRALALLCESLASERSLRETIAREGHTIASGSGATKAHPALAALDRTRQIAQRMLAEFGLNPRGRVGLPPPGAPRRDNPFASFGKHRDDDFNSF